MKKIISFFLIFSFCSLNLALLSTPYYKAHAQAAIVSDPPDEVANYGSLLKAIKQWEETLSGKVFKRLANKVLNKMLKKTVNWALTGFGPWESGGNSGGQPFYIQNTDSLLKNVTDQALIKSIQAIQDSCQDSSEGCPYGKNLARSLVTNAIYAGKQGIQQKFNLNQYSPNWQEFANVSNPQAFSQGGGWQTWEGMNSNPQNTPLGAYLATAFEISQQQQHETGKYQTELANNNGFLSLRKCVAYVPGKEPTSEIDFSLFGKKKNTPVATAPEYDFDTTYQPGDHVTYANGEYEAIQENKGTPPGGSALSAQFWGQVIAPPNPNQSQNSEDYGISNGTGNAYTDFFGSTYALPGMTVDNCMRYEVTTPGIIAKEQLSKALTSNIDKQIADSTTGNPLLDSLVDMAAIFVEQGLDKLITKATTKNGDQKIYVGGIEGNDTTYLNSGNGANTNSPWYSESGKYSIVIQNPYNPQKLHQSILEEMEYTELELDQIEASIELLRAQPQMYKNLDECLPGPDLDWEQRLKDEFSRSSRRLDKKSQKDNSKGDKAQEAINRLERYRDKEISITKISMNGVIPSALPIQSKLKTISNINSEINQLENKLTQKNSALVTLKEIQEALAEKIVSDGEIRELKKQYMGIKNKLGTEETLQDITDDRERIAADVYTSFDKTNPTSLLSKCIRERKDLSNIQIGEDVGETLFCNWQTHSSTTNFYTSPYDGNRVVSVLVGKNYTQDEAPFDSGGKNSEFTVDCDKYYRAPMSIYEK